MNLPILKEGVFDDEEIVEQINNKFYKANLLDEFLHLYSLFYENRVILPYYFSLFYGQNKTDNPQNTYELGQKFKQLTLKGVIATSSQVSIPYKQKAYINMFVSETLAEKLTLKLNCYNHIIAFYSQMNNDGVEGLYVTYKKCQCTGNGFDKGVYDEIYELLNPTLQDIFDKQNYCDLTIMDADFTHHQDYLIDLLLNVINGL
jgi:hypothetical protein